ncbi:MAG: hypothetical protein ACREKL_03890 [Chthoniobacterales bacterium]
MRTRTELFLLAAFLLAGCAGPTFAPDLAPEYVAVRGTPLYRDGPQQGGAPEAQIPKDDRVRMLRHEFGYSFVQMSDGMTGYVANMDLAPAPPLPEPVPAPPEETSRDFAPMPPLAEPPLPKPDMDLPPADAPAR